MKRLMLEIIVVVAFVLVAFATGLEVGHRKGYDTAWVECKHDAKEELSLTGNKAFWKWYGSNATHIRKHRSLFQ